MTTLRNITNDRIATSVLGSTFEIEASEEKAFIDNVATELIRMHGEAKLVVVGHTPGVTFQPMKKEVVDPPLPPVGDGTAPAEAGIVEPETTAKRGRTKKSSVTPEA